MPGEVEAGVTVSVGWAGVLGAEGIMKELSRSFVSKNLMLWKTNTGIIKVAYQESAEHIVRIYKSMKALVKLIYML